MTTDDTTARPGGPTPLRIGDAERQRMTELLQRHVAAGRLDMTEFERRVEHATAAVYERDLDGLLDDLPPIDEDGEPVRTHRGHGNEPPAGGEDAASWWPPAGMGRSRPPWAARGFPFPVLALGAVAVVVLTHGWILFPLLFLFFIARGGCGPRHHQRQRHDWQHRAAHGRARHDDAGERPSWPGRFEPSGDDRML